MPGRVQRVITTNWKIDITSMLNDAAAQYDFDAVGFLAGAIAESDLDELAVRERAWPDVSHGLFQETVKWHSAHISGVELAADGTAKDTPRNRQLHREWFWDAGRSIGYTAPRYAALVKKWGSPLEAWCRWNLPSVSGSQNPNRANYQRGLRKAETYRVPEGRVRPLVRPVVEQNQFSRAHYDTDAEWRQMQGASCSAASLAAVLTAYGIPTNISAALRRIRATGDDVTAELGLLNRLGQSVAIERALDAAGIASTRYLWADFDRHRFMAVLDSGRPIVCQVQRYLGRFGHYLVATRVLPDRSGVYVADSNTGSGKRTQYKWDGGAGIGLWNDMAGGTATWSDLVQGDGTVAEIDDVKKELAAVKAQRDGLVSAVAYLADDLSDRVARLQAAQDDAAQALIKEAARVRLQFVGPRPA